MRVLIAGASGAIGRPLVRRLKANQHQVFALARSLDSAPALKDIGAEPVIADALDAAAVKAAVGQIRPDAVINELTSLPRHYTPAEMEAAAERDRRVRVGGNINLLAALRDASVRRYLLQSSGFWYASSPGPAAESVPLTSSASPGVEAGARTYRELMGDQVGFASCRAAKCVGSFSGWVRGAPARKSYRHAAAHRVIRTRWGRSWQALNDHNTCWFFLIIDRCVS